ncbi:GNAT family N-acetyltransferase [Nonlabens ponticola]|nr:GNAT family N-acetyltransferase [Nonlabens ponticola]
MMRIYRPVYQHLWFDDGSEYVYSQYNEEQLKTDLADSNAVYYFVNFNKQIVGIFRFIEAVMPSIKNTKAIKLLRLYLDPAVHGLGIGKELISWLIAYARKQNFDCIWLESMDSQQQAIQFYKKVGFEIDHAFVLDSPSMRSTYRGMYRMKLNL